MMKESNYKKTKKKLPQNSSFLQDTIFLYCEYLLCQLYLDAGLRFAATFFNSFRQRAEGCPYTAFGPFLKNHPKISPSTAAVRIVLGMESFFLIKRKLLIPAIKIMFQEMAPSGK